MNKLRLTMAERQAIQDKLPGSTKNGYTLIEQKLAKKGVRISRQLISKAFTIDERYRADVFDAAIEVIKDFSNQVDNQREALAVL